MQGALQGLAKEQGTNGALPREGAGGGGSPQLWARSQEALALPLSVPEALQGPRFWSEGL